jgi:hypothetical protein
LQHRMSEWLRKCKTQSVILSEAKNLVHAGPRPFASLRVTNRTKCLPQNKEFV